MISPDTSPATIQKRVASGSYRVNPELVAARMVERGEEELDGKIVGRKSEQAHRMGKEYGGHHAG